MQDVNEQSKRNFVLYDILLKFWEKKLRIFNSTVKLLFLFEFETWKTANMLTREPDSFVNKCFNNIIEVWDLEFSYTQSRIWLVEGR